MPSAESGRQPTLTAISKTANASSTFSPEG
jgi:hypothetical protein